MSQSARNPKYTVRVGNVFFLSRIGLSLRWATQSMARKDLPADVRKLLAGLDELEAQEAVAQDEASGPERIGCNPTRRIFICPVSTQALPT
jgi:hypothetical protein